MSYLLGAVRIFFVSLILCCLGAHDGSAFEITAAKSEGRWNMLMLEDKFTKKRTVTMTGRKEAILGKGLRAIAICPNRQTLKEDGTLTPSKLISIVDHRNETLVGSASTQKLMGVIIDEVMIDLSGDTWMKDLITTMLKGQEITIRVESHASGERRVVTTSAPLEGFAACWGAVPQDLIDLETNTAIANSVRRDLDNARLKQDLIDNGPQTREWTSRDGSAKFEGILASYEKATGKAKIKRKKDGRIFAINKDRLSASDQSYLNVVGKLGRIPFLSPAFRQRLRK